MVSFKKKSESLIKYYIKVTCALKWARKLPRKTETYESAKCVPCNTRKCTHNGFVSDLLKWALKCRFYATGPCCLKSRKSREVSFAYWHMVVSSWWISVHVTVTLQCARYICLHFRKVSFTVVTKCELRFKLGLAAGINTSIILRSSNPFLSRA